MPVAKRYILQQVSTEVNGNCPSKNTMVQLSTPILKLSTTKHNVRQTNRWRQNRVNR